MKKSAHRLTFLAHAPAPGPGQAHPPNFSRLVREAIRGATPGTISQALFDRFFVEKPELVKKTVTLDEEAFSTLNGIASMARLSVEETVRLILEAHAQNRT